MIIPLLNKTIFRGIFSINVLQNYRTVDMNGGSLSHSDWHNLYETVFQEHRGEKEYTDKLEQQITLFQVNAFSTIWNEMS